MMAAAGLFTLGFGGTFTALGAIASWLGAALLGHKLALVQVAGVFVAAMGVVTVLGGGLLGLAREWRLVAPHRVPLGSEQHPVPWTGSWSIRSCRCG
jgi:cytochrome c biogenesis protein CcdA